MYSLHGEGSTSLLVQISVAALKSYLSLQQAVPLSKDSRNVKVYTSL